MTYRPRGMTAILESHDGTEGGALNADRLIQLSRTLRPQIHV
jgi:hypothetical protein